MSIIKDVLHLANTHTTNSLKFYSTFHILLTHYTQLHHLQQHAVICHTCRLPHTGFAHKECGSDGEWYKHPLTNKTWSNYTTCINFDDLEVSWIWNNVHAKLEFPRKHLCFVLAKYLLIYLLYLPVAHYICISMEQLITPLMLAVAISWLRNCPPFLEMNLFRHL